MTQIRYLNEGEYKAGEWLAVRKACQDAGLNFAAQDYWLKRHMPETVAKIAMVSMRSNGRPTTLPSLHIQVSAVPKWLAARGKTRPMAPEAAKNVAEAVSAMPTTDDKLSRLEDVVAKLADNQARVIPELKSYI
jgi:hypothetical protein